MDSLPQKKVLMDAIVTVMRQSGRTMTTAEIDNNVIDFLHIPKPLLEIEDANCTGTEYSYRMRWARTELKQKQMVFSCKRGEWSLV